MARTLFSASKEAPDVKPNLAEGGGKKGAAKKNANANAKAGAKAAGGAGVTFPDSDLLNPLNQPLTLECWVLPDDGDGILFNHGAGQTGYALSLKGKKPAFDVRCGHQRTGGKNSTRGSAG